MIGLIEALLAKHDLSRKDIAGVGVGSPGPLNPETGVIGKTPNLGWENFPLRQKMEEALGVPVAVGNDVDLGTYGEYHFGAARGGRNVLGVFPGTGIGGGLVINGRLHQGSSGAAAEVGHIVLDPNGIRCGCGNRGCLEAYASRLAISARASVAVMRGAAPVLAGLAGSDPANMRSAALAEAIAGGDAEIEEIVRDAARKIGQVIGGLVNVISPDIVVLGGGLVEAMEDLFLTEVRKMIKRTALPEIEAAVQVVAAKLGDDAVVMGAARIIREKIESQA
jgi:glucokinase